MAMVFLVKKFRHYLLYNPMVFFVDHMTIKFLVNKPELSGRLARWVLLLEEFDYTIEYKPDRIHLQADHLSRLSEGLGVTLIDDMLMDENIFVVTVQPEWYSRIIKFFTTQQLLASLTKVERRKIRVNIRHFAVIENRLFRRGADGILCRCVTAIEVLLILAFCHDNVCGGHFFGQLTGQNT